MCSTKKNEHKLIHNVREFLTRWHIPQNSRIIIAFSGGPDSTALLHCLFYLKQEWSLTLFCAYLDHGLRTQTEIQKEIYHIKKTVQLLDLDILIHHYKPGELAEQARLCKQSPEEVARDTRYKFLHSLLNQYECNYIALGHTFDDQIETMLMRIFQGSGLAGLTGISEKRDKLLRPLLNCTRQEILNYLSGENITYFTDSSNKSIRFLRNKVRHKLIPAIHKVFPGFKKALSQFHTKMNYAYDYIQPQINKQLIWNTTAKGLRVPIKEFLQAPPIIRLYSIYWHINKLERQKSFLKKKRIPFSFLKDLLELESVPTDKIMLRAYGIIVYSNEDMLFLERDVVVPIKKGYFIDVKLNTAYILDGKNAAFRYYFTEKTKGKSEFSLIKKEIIMPLTLRSRKQGDRIDFGWGHKKIKKIFNEHKIPQHERNQIPILEDRSGVVAIIGITFGLKNFFRKGVAIKDNLHDNGLHCIIEPVEQASEYE